MRHLLGDEDLVLEVARELGQRRNGRDEPAVADAALAGVGGLHVRKQHGAGVQRPGAQPAGLSEEVLRGALPESQVIEIDEIDGNLDLYPMPNSIVYGMYTYVLVLIYMACSSTCKHIKRH